MQSIPLEQFDLKEKHKDIPTPSIRFEHFKLETQAVLETASLCDVHGFFQRGQTYQAVYAPKNNLIYYLVRYQSITGGDTCPCNQLFSFQKGVTEDERQELIDKAFEYFGGKQGDRDGVVVFYDEGTKGIQYDPTPILVPNNIARWLIKNKTMTLIENH